MVSKLKEQLDAVREEISNWPDWRKQEIEAEVSKTPIKSKSNQKAASDENRPVGGAVAR
jgi:hypothetical protein